MSSVTVEKMNGTPEELKNILPHECWMPGGYCIVRDDGELMSSGYATREDAENAIRINEENSGNQ